ncbi:hypothetical protein [Aeromonas sanarellii]|uniref:hypothetical protein n=1 Tax=Aeromonas sanarellii TaxID=633415 RepID=UPI0039862B5E
MMTKQDIAGTIGILVVEWFVLPLATSKQVVVTVSRAVVSGQQKARRRAGLGDKLLIRVFVEASSVDVV